MTPDVNTIELKLPTTIAAYVVSNEDATFTIVLNSRMTFERRLIAYTHELKHIENGDYDKRDVDLIEIHAHKIH